MNLTRSARLMEDHLEHLIAARNDMNRIVRDMLASYDNANAQQKIRMRSIIHDSLSLAASCDSILENWQTMRRSIHRGDVEVADVLDESLLSLIFQSFLNLRTTALASGGASIKSSEDCLHLDIFTPSDPESVNLPVLFSIYGGGYTFGNGANAAAGLNFVNRSDGGMIFVTIQYRLGGYGFLSPDAIEEDGAPNARLLDERAATESLSEEALTNAIDASYEIGYAQGLYAYGYFYYGPAVDGRIIQDLPSQELEAGNLAKVPLITDHTTFERAGFSNLSTRTLQ
ncbi:hypothetical protein D6D20_07924 [Aureobasidium pullulans]|uniref:Carboxylesterase type B domain-containing protein n=1 Tax=Aureobasidium pullulans TaxID=5580 RepID=A0A4S8Z020_AURPU|nr:hypothetical protein D6D20_07924 [Aureobasidium pullulans]